MDDLQLERYLAAVEVRLRALSPTQRDEELRELRQHLDALIAGHRARGLGEDEAVAAALRQFGRAERLGWQLHRATVRAGMPPLWPLLLFYASMVGLIFAFLATANDKLTDFPATSGGQLALALLLPSGMLVMRLIHYLRARNSHPQR